MPEPVLSQAPAFDAWLDAFFDSYFLRRPVNATFIGVHRHDSSLPDFSERGIAATLADTEDLLQRLRALRGEPLSESQSLDRQLAEGFLLIQRWESRSLHFGPGNPTLLTGEAVFGVISLLLRPFAPLEERLDMAAARLNAVADFLANGTRHIKSAPAAWIERARHECTGALLLIRVGLPALLRDESVEHAEMRSAAHDAAHAFERFDQFLAHDVVPTSEYAAGGEALALVLRYAHMLPMDADELERLALARIAEEEAALSGTPPAPVEVQPADRTPSTYLERFDKLWRATRDLATERDVLRFPEWPVRFAERPGWARDAAPYLYFLPYRSPAPFDAMPEVEYLVPPGSDEPTIKLNHVIHHGSIGHHVQNWFAARAASRIGQIAAVDCASRIAMLCGGTMAEGWATYATDLAQELGFLTPAEAFSQHHARLRMAARAVVDIRLHQGRFTLEDAVNFYADRVAMPVAAANSEAVKNSLFPGAGCMYLAGWEGIWRLRHELAARDGATFSLRAFHDRLLSFGSIPVSLIARAMLESLSVPALATT